VQGEPLQLDDLFEGVGGDLELVVLYLDFLDPPEFTTFPLLSGEDDGLPCSVNRKSRSLYSDKALLMSFQSREVPLCLKATLVLWVGEWSKPSRQTSWVDMGLLEEKRERDELKKK